MWGNYWRGRSSSGKDLAGKIHAGKVLSGDKTGEENIGGENTGGENTIAYYVKHPVTGQVVVVYLALKRLATFTTRNDETFEWFV